MLYSLSMQTTAHRKIQYTKGVTGEKTGNHIPKHGGKMKYGNLENQRLMTQPVNGF